MMVAAPRYAVYWVPEADHPLWQAGCKWLGRDPTRAEAAAQPPAFAVSPWRYGFHATLKAPMRLRDGTRATDFLRMAGVLAARTRPFTMPPLQVAWLGRFLAIRPVGELQASHPLHELADTCVRELDEWRAGASAEDIQRYTGTGLNSLQADALVRWGYPHVFEAWRFHMTLTDTLEVPNRALEDAARAHFAAALAQPLKAQSLAVFIQTEPNSVFRLARRLPFMA